MNVIDCKPIRDEMLKEARERNPGGLKLVIISVEGDPASEVYIRNKVRTCEEVGIDCYVEKCPNDITVDKLRDAIVYHSCNSLVTGVILQLPLQDHLKPYERELVDFIPWYKDVDGLSHRSVGRLWSDLPCITPATPTGILRLLPEDLSGRDVTIVNRSNLIGKPLIKMLLDRNATVSVCHSKTDFVSAYTYHSDVVITGIGKAEYFDELYVGHDQVWIDCGIDRNIDGKLCGDLYLDSLDGFDILVTPVPGGVGILTTAQLMLNVIKAYELQRVRK